MGGSSVPMPAPVVVQGPTDAEIQAQKSKEAADAARARKSSVALDKNKSTVASQSRNTGFSGSGVYIPGRS